MRKFVTPVGNEGMYILDTLFTFSFRFSKYSITINYKL